LPEKGGLITTFLLHFHRPDNQAKMIGCRKEAK
jgi:hypothetical protein